ENLFTNAIKNNEASGSIDVTVVEDDKSIEVRLEDTGIGLDESINERVIDRFLREDSCRNRKLEGTGLGLAVVSRSVELHDGDIQIDSLHGKGTTISVYLPNEQ